MRAVKLLTLLVVVVVCHPIHDSWATAPRISFAREVEDLGQIRSGQKVTVRFQFSNSGNGNLTIQRVEADCGCTEISETRRNVPPRGIGEIVAVLDTTGLPGRKEKHIHVQSNDPQRPTVTLTMVVEVVSELRRITRGSDQRYPGLNLLFG